MNKLLNALKIVLLVALFPLTSSCNNDDSSSNNVSYNFDYDLEDLVGIWESSEMLDDTSGEWLTVDGTDNLYTIFSFKIRFESNYSYTLDGYISNESGSYTLSNSIVATYADGSLTAEYDIKSLSNGQMELTLVRGTDASDYRLSKRW